MMAYWEVESCGATRHWLLVVFLMMRTSSIRQEVDTQYSRVVAKVVSRQRQVVLVNRHDVVAEALV